MLNTLSRNQRTIAWFLVTLFYLEFISVPLMARASERPLPYRSPVHTTGAWKDESLNNKTPFIWKEVKKKPEKNSGNSNVQRKHSPVHGKQHFTTGPTQPETQSFQSVNANNMVDLFTGDFSYNIPLLDVGGYPVNLHYQSGITMDQEASWVGLGWNINPGVISRNMRGLPDDFQGGEDKVTKTVSMKPNLTVGVNAGGNLEIFGFPLNLSARYGVFYNNYKGFGTEWGLNASISAGLGSKGHLTSGFDKEGNKLTDSSKAHLTAGLSIANNSQSGLDISSSMGFQLGRNQSKTTGDITIGTNYNSRAGIQALQVTGEVKQTINSKKKLAYSVGTGINAGISFCKPSYTPTINVPYSSYQIVYAPKIGSQQAGVFPNLFFSGYASIQKIEDEDKTVSLPAFGYLYYDKANGSQDVLLDFNREKDIAWSENTPHIAVPMYTYDTWSVSGEGTGGMFRAYRNDIGFVYDHRIGTKSNSDRLGVEVGFGDVFHAGLDYNKTYASTQNNAWTGDNRLVDVIAFRSSDTSYENVYFKNPGEKTSVNKQYHKAIGDEYLMRADLQSGKNNEVVTASRIMSLFKNSKPIGKDTFDLNTVRQTRDKRTQVISYLTADQAAYAALEKNIRSYHLNSFPSATCTYGIYDSISRKDDTYHKAHHISEITVLNPDGRRYVYGVPVYNKAQIDVTMASQVGDNSTGLVSYDSTKDNTVKNSQGKDGYFNKEQLPPYAHSYLLSGILSSDYVDIAGDGITDDDHGDAVRFNYSQAYTLATPYRWRAPFNESKASYNEGLKTDKYDERGTYSYGEREVWYLNSVESKTMIATFTLETDTVRKDGYGVKGENGGRDAGQKLYRLKEINLYTKADYLKNGQYNAKPVKTVHFDYSYDLCKNNPGSDDSTGKLTLNRVWFSYNKNNKGKRNPYVFTYNGTNPDYNAKAVDRWSNYKSPSDNPGTDGALTNADYSYTLQNGVKTWDSAKADSNAAAWTLSEIGLPSGGKIKVAYESDDYAYVQNKRAMQFFSITGFGNSPSDQIKGNLYPDKKAHEDYHYVFVKVSQPVSDRNDIQRKYLDGVTQLFFKLAVNMPADNRGNGFEIINCYAEI